METKYKIGQELFYLEPYGINSGTVGEIRLKGKDSPEYYFGFDKTGRPEYAVAESRDELILKLMKK
jgi:hypothetical protein